MIYFYNPASTFNITILINLAPKRPAQKRPALKRPAPKSHIGIGEPRASWWVGQVGVCAIKLQCVAGKQSKRKFMNEQAYPVLSFNSDLVVRRFVFLLS